MCNLRFSTLILCKCTVNIAQFVDLLNTHFSFPKALVSHVISCHVKSRWCFLCTIVFPTAGDNCFIRDISGMLQLHLEDPGATVQSDASWLCMHDSFSPSWLRNPFRLQSLSVVPGTMTKTLRAYRGDSCGSGMQSYLSCRVLS